MTFTDIYIEFKDQFWESDKLYQIKAFYTLIWFVFLFTQVFHHIFIEIGIIAFLLIFNEMQ